MLALVLNVAANAAWVATSMGGLKDLDSFLHSGAAFARGLDPYEYYTWLQPPPISPEALNLNPPISVYLFEPLTGIDRGVLGAAFLLGSLAMVAASTGLLMRAYPEKRHWLFVLVVLAMAGMWQMLFYLQVYAPLVLATTGAWLLLRRGDWLLAGVLIGLVVAMKPNYALVPLVLFVAGHWRPSVTAGVTAGLVSAVPLVLEGPGIYRQWLQMTNSFAGYEWTSNASLVSVGQRMDVDPAGVVAAALLAVAVLAVAWRCRPAVLDAMALGILTVILVGPVSWAGYTLLLLPFLFSIRWDSWAWASVAILIVPFAPERAIASFGVEWPSVFTGAASGVSGGVPSTALSLLGAVFGPLLGAIYAWGVLLLLVRLVQRLRPEPGLIPRMNRLRLPALDRRPASPRPAIDDAHRAPQPVTVRVPYE